MKQVSRSNNVVLKGNEERFNFAKNDGAFAAAIGRLRRWASWVFASMCIVRLAFSEDYKGNNGISHEIPRIVQKETGLSSDHDPGDQVIT